MDRRALGLALPAGVLERLPQLKDERCVFFDFGMMLFSPPQAAAAAASLAQVPVDQMTKEPIVAVITEKGLVAATFPRATRVPKFVPHDRVSGVSKDGDHVVIHVNGESDLRLLLTKADTFVVYLVDLQDRAMGRSLHFAARSSTKSAAAQQLMQKANDLEAFTSATRGLERVAVDYPSAGGGDSIELARLTAAALQQADRALTDDEVSLGVVRFGRASRRADRPPTEMEEGSDASSVATIDHEVGEPLEAAAVDFPLVSIDATTLRRRLFYFFQHYDRAKLPHIDEMLQHHRGRETKFLQELEAQYGPEPSKARWETRDQIAHQRALRDQLVAQLKRAKDELLLLNRDEATLQRSRERVALLSANFAEELRDRFLRNAGRSSSVAEQLKQKERALRRERGAGFSLLRVTRLVETVSPSPEPRSSQEGLLLESTTAFWIAPASCFDFVREQTERVHGASLPPLCVVDELDECDGPSKRSFLCNWSFLAGWAVEFGHHSVAIVAQRTNDVKYVASKRFWRST